VNTAIIPIIINIDVKNWFLSGGLVSDIFYIFLFTNFLDPVLYFFDVAYFGKKILREMERRKGKNSRLTQGEANL
jgi:hypothetical protein